MQDCGRAPSISTAAAYYLWRNEFGLKYLFDNNTLETEIKFKLEKFKLDKDLQQKVKSHLLE